MRALLAKAQWFGLSPLRLSTLDNRVSVEWAHLGTGVPLIRQWDDRSELTPWLGMSVHTAFPIGTAESISNWATLPAIIAGNVHLDWPVRAGLTGTWTVLPALKTTGESALASQSVAALSIFTGQIGPRSTMLEVGIRWTSVHIGSLLLPPSDLRIGMRAEGL